MSRDTERVVLVTGGSGGIGRAVALALADAGHRVAITFRNNKHGADETIDAITALGADGFAVHCDQGCPTEVDEAFGAIESRWGAVEIVVNNAGQACDRPLALMGDAAWRSVLATNLDGAFFVMRRAAKGLIKNRWGRIINIGSVSGLRGVPGQTNYSASKAGLLGLTRAAAWELAKRNVTCNLINPGPIETPMVQDLGQEHQNIIRGLVPLGRFGRPEEVAAAVGFLASEAAGYVTGAVLAVDGGMGMGA